MSKARDLADSVAAGSVLADGVVSLSEVGGGTNNGVVFVDGSGTTTSGSALTFDGTNLGIGTNSPVGNLVVSTGAVGSANSNFRHIVAEGTGNSGITILSGSTSIGALNFGDAGGNQAGSVRYNHNVDHLLINVANETKVTIDSSGNLGLGVAPSASSLSGVIEGGYGTFGQTSSLGSIIAGNAYYNSGWKYKLSSAATLHTQDSGGISWSVAGIGTPGSAISFTQAMRLTTGGNLGVGTPSPATTYSRNVQIDGSVSAGLRFTSTSYTAGFDVVLSAGDAYLLNRNNTALIFSTNATERARIDSSGELTTTNGKFNLITVGRGAGAVATNTAVGASALAANTSGSVNSAFGYQAGYSLTTGTFNNFFGQNSAYYQTTGSYNIAIGQGALQGVSGQSNTGSNNTAVGNNALLNNTTASNSTAVGYQAGYANTTGNYLTAIGYQAGLSNTTGAFNFFGGAQVGYSNTTGNYNSFAGGQDSTGYPPGFANTTGSNNTAFGSGSLGKNTTASNNTAVGYQAGYSNTTGTRITAIGYQAAKGGAGSAPSYSVAVGSYALSAVTSGDSNVAVGDNTLPQLTTGAANSFVGGSAGNALTTGSYNTAVGTSSLFSNTTASNNTAVGYQAGYNNTTGGVTALGKDALRSNTTGTGNVSLGNSAGYSITTSSYNTHIGHFTGYYSTGGGNTFVGNAGSAGSVGCGYYMTTGSNNTIIGGYTGNQGGLDLRTANNYIVLSDGDGAVRMFASPTYVNLGGAGSADTSLVYSFGTYNYTSGGAANMGINSSGFMYRSTSSLKYKKNIQDATHGLAEVLQLRPVTYESKQEAESGNVYGGLIAEEVHEAGLTEFVQYAEDGTPDALAYSNMVSLCVKAIQELKSELDTVKAELATLKGN